MMERLIIILALIMTVTCQATPVKPGVPFSGATQFRSWTYYTIPASEATINYVKVTSTIESGVPFFYMNVNTPPSFTNYKWKYENTTAKSVSSYCYSPNVSIFEGGDGNVTIGDIIFAVYGYSDTKYTITLDTQGPLMLSDRQIYTPEYPVPNEAYIFYKFNVNNFVRKIQIYAEAGLSDGTFFFVVDNSTTAYPIYDKGKYKYTSTDAKSGSGWSSCLEVDYPYPGAYRLGLFTYKQPYKIQFIQNHFENCQFEF